MPAKILQLCDVDTAKVIFANGLTWPVLLSNADLIVKICVGILTCAWLIKKLCQKPKGDDQ